MTDQESVLLDAQGIIDKLWNMRNHKWSKAKAKKTFKKAAGPSSLKIVWAQLSIPLYWFTEPCNTTQDECIQSRSWISWTSYETKRCYLNHQSSLHDVKRCSYSSSYCTWSKKTFNKKNTRSNLVGMKCYIVKQKADSTKIACFLQASKISQGQWSWTKIPL